MSSPYIIEALLFNSFRRLLLTESDEGVVPTVTMFAEAPHPPRQGPSWSPDEVAGESPSSSSVAGTSSSRTINGRGGSSSSAPTRLHSSQHLPAVGKTRSVPPTKMHLNMEHSSAGTSTHPGGHSGISNSAGVRSSGSHGTGGKSGGGGGQSVPGITKCTGTKKQLSDENSIRWLAVQRAAPPAASSSKVAKKAMATSSPSTGSAKRASLPRNHPTAGEGDPVSSPLPPSPSPLPSLPLLPVLLSNPPPLRSRFLIVHSILIRPLLNSSLLHPHRLLLLHFLTMLRLTR